MAAIAQFGLLYIPAVHTAHADGTDAMSSASLLLLGNFMEDMNPAGMPAEPGSSSSLDCTLDIDPDVVVLTSFQGFGDGGIQTATTDEANGEDCLTAPTAAAVDIFVTLTLLGGQSNNPSMAGEDYNVFWGTSPALVLDGDFLCPLGCTSFGVIRFEAQDVENPLTSRINVKLGEAVLFFFSF